MSQKIVHRRNYREARKAEYPDVGDQLDAIWGVLRTMKVPKEAQDVVAEIDRIKARYPKS
jgi:hypothetical protein